MTLLNILAQPSEIARTIQQADEKESKRKQEEIFNLQKEFSSSKNNNNEISEIKDNMEQSSELFVNQQMERYTDKKERQKNLNYLNPVEQLIQDYSKMDENHSIIGSADDNYDDDKNSDYLQQQFMQKHGIGLKNKQKQEQEYLRKLYHNKSPLSDTKILNQQQQNSQNQSTSVIKRKKEQNPRALEELETLKAKREEESTNKMKVEQLKEQRERMIKIKIKEKRERQNVIVGIGAESGWERLVRDEGSVKPQKQQVENQFLDKLLDFQNDEDRESETFQISCKKYEKALKFLFEKYSTASTTSGIIRNPYATDLIKESTAITLANI
eukprot:TRINITY_DN15061_c0_g1_i1.p1 TRINITY_DN15061_c0_g1~~TRINITY_DN15061_c0_g1_i1.p1  ORF type:complete len:327 (-),score=57.45 TRINITY_DN15061_c0_g1_i1:926-1906(-)